MLAMASFGVSTPIAAPRGTAAPNPPAYLVSHEQMLHWLSNTDAKLNFVGAPPNPLASRDGPTTTVTFCSSRIDSICGGTCNVYTGGPTCVDAPGTSCLAATNDVAFCDRGGCGGSCNLLSTCGSPLDNGFCSTPGTASIVVQA